MNSALSLHSIFGDHMVVQRDKPVRFSGTASACATITASFHGLSRTATAGPDGAWSVEFPAFPAGGPFDLVVSHACHASARIVVRDILVGDVWFCSGQSNMEFPVWGESPFFRLKDGRELAAAAHDDRIRLFQSPLCVEIDRPCSEPPGRPRWKPATTPEAVREFSAVGYWFGLGLRQALGEDVPIGLINSSWGGTLIEPWISEDAYRAAGRSNELGQIKRARALRDDTSGAVHEAIVQEFALACAGLKNWIHDKFLACDPAASAAALASWARPGLDTAAWSPLPQDDARWSIPQPATVWFRCEFDLPPEAIGHKAIVRIGAVNDCDETFLDGIKIGSTSSETLNYWCAPRNYTATLRPAPAGARHVLAIRAMDHFSSGGITGPVTLSIDLGDTTCEIDLGASGTWFRRTEFDAPVSQTGPRPAVPVVSDDPRNSCQTPSTLFNAMVHPYLDLALKGVLWYQGCSNSGNPADYLVLQRLWVDDWRRAWHDPSLPFLVTQLAAYNAHHPEQRTRDDFWTAEGPGDNPGFAPLREVQDAFVASEPGRLGIACTIDIGDHSDIHPANKRDVGLRLAHEALRLAYGDASALPSPRLRSATREGRAMRLAFDNVGDGLFVDGDAFGPHLFALGDASGALVWADATLCPDSTVLVSSPAIAEPTVVQYAFSAFPPKANLYRKGDRLPVLPFRTDTPPYLAR